MFLDDRSYSSSEHIPKKKPKAQNKPIFNNNDTSDSEMQNPEPEPDLQ